MEQGALLHASFGKRFGALGIDVGALVAFFIASAMLSGPFGGNEENWTKTAAVVVWFFIVVLPFVVYFGLQLLWVATRGQTIGKRITGIVVVMKDTGKQVSLFEALVREVVKILFSLPPLGLVQLLTIAFSHPTRGVHDFFMGTLVVEKTHSHGKVKGP